MKFTAPQYKIKTAILVLLLLSLTACTCFMAPYTPTKYIYHRSKYYGKKSDQNPLLKFNSYYGTVNPGNSPDLPKYYYNLYRFYPEGIILHDAFYSDLILDSMYNYSYDYLVSKCHGNTMGCYQVKGDTLRFETTVGYQHYWTQYTAVLEAETIRIIDFRIKGQSRVIGDSILKANLVAVRKAFPLKPK